MFPFFPPFFFIYSFDNLVSVSTFRLIQLYMLIAGRTKLPHSLPPPSFIGYSASLSFFFPLARNRNRIKLIRGPPLLLL